MAPRRNSRLITLLLFVLVAFLTAYAQEAPLNGFDDYVNKALREWEVPAVAIAIVKDDRIVAKGYGVNADPGLSAKPRFNAEAIVRKPTPGSDCMPASQRRQLISR